MNDRFIKEVWERVIKDYVNNFWMKEEEEKKES